MNQSINTQKQAQSQIDVQHSDMKYYVSTVETLHWVFTVTPGSSFWGTYKKNHGSFLCYLTVLWPYKFNEPNENWTSAPHPILYL